MTVFPDWPYFSKGRPDVHTSCQDVEGNMTGLEKPGDGGIELYNPSPACLPVFVQQGLQPKKTNRARERSGCMGVAKLHSQADADR